MGSCWNFYDELMDDEQLLFDNSKDFKEEDYKFFEGNIVTNGITTLYIIKNNKTKFKGDLISRQNSFTYYNVVDFLDNKVKWVFQDELDGFAKVEVVTEFSDLWRNEGDVLKNLNQCKK